MSYHELWRLLAQVYDEGEAKALARMVYEVRYGLSLADIYSGKDTQLSADSQTELTEISQRLLQQEPIQYILGQATFCGRTFTVNPSVLIPRPETEELCRWILKSEECESGGLSPCEVLDIGTGSGCIAITLAAELPDARVTAWDISAEALEVARENAKRAHVHVSFEQIDALKLNSLATPHAQRENATRNTLNAQRSHIVSNPPYICHREREAMEANVLQHEPHVALFVPDDDPLLFYRAIAQYGQTALRPGGWLYFEINPLYATDLRDMLAMMSYRDIETKEDQYGKQRMIRACREKGKKVRR